MRDATTRRQQTMTRRTIFEAKKCFQDYEILSIDFVPDLTAYFCVLWVLVFNHFFDVFLGSRSNPGSHLFASSLTDGRSGNTERANLTWLPSEIMHRGHTLLTGDLECPCLVLEIWLLLIRQGWITYYACQWHHLFTSLARARSTRAKWNSSIWDHFIFDHLNSYLWMPTKEKFYEYVRNATHGKKCYVIQGSRKMFLTVPARFFIVLIVSKFAERWLRN